MVRSGCDMRIDVFARMTVSGVFSSCEASATNCRCCSHARFTGRRAQREKNTLITKKIASATTPTPARVSARVCHPLAELTSANATRAMPVSEVRFS